MGCRYIYSIYDAKSGALVAKGDAAKLVGLGLFRDAGVLSTSYHKNRECKRPRKYRIEREKVVKTFVMTTPQKALRSMHDHWHCRRGHCHCLWRLGHRAGSACDLYGH